MFRASSCISSGAATTAVAASGLPLERGGSSAVGRGRADRNYTKMHGPKNINSLKICCFKYCFHSSFVLVNFLGTFITPLIQVTMMLAIFKITIDI
jgi:hypothetical protein